MANDNLLAALTGLLESAASVAVPFAQKRYQTNLELELAKAKQPLELDTYRKEQAIRGEQDVSTEKAKLPFDIQREQAKQEAEFSRQKRLAEIEGKTIKNDKKSEARKASAKEHAAQRLVSMRGDQSLARTELQRDGSIAAYDTITKAQKENRGLSQFEYYDILGQLWKARSGSAPTDQSLKDLDAKTFKGDIGKVYQYFSGKPAPRTTQAVMSGMKKFIKDTGELLDKQHEAYMKPHLIKPVGIDENDWKEVMDVGRGRSFSEAMKDSESYAPSTPLHIGKEKVNDPQIEKIQNQLPEGSEFIGFE